KNKAKHLIRIKGSKKLTKAQKQEIKTFYSTYDLKNISTLWHQFYYSCNDQFSPQYIPEDLFYVHIEPSLNRPDFVNALADKNLLDTLFPGVKQPQTLFKNINGHYYHNDEL